MDTLYYPKGMRVIERRRYANHEDGGLCASPGACVQCDAEIISVRRTAVGKHEVLTDTGRYYDGLTGRAIDSESGIYRCIIDPRYVKGDAMHADAKEAQHGSA